MALGIDTGPVIGTMLDELEAASFAGEIRNREQALERARQLLSATAGAGDEGRPAGDQ